MAVVYLAQDVECTAFHREVDTQPLFAYKRLQSREDNAVLV